VWLRHWSLARDPFAPGGRPYIATPGHDEAVARLVHAIRSGLPSAVVRGEAGVGKSVVLTKALAEVRSPGLRVATSVAPADGASLLQDLARSLRLRIPDHPAVPRVWRALADAARLIREQRGRLILAIDSAESLDGPDDLRHLDRLLHLDPDGDPAPTLIRVERLGDRPAPPSDAFPIRLGPLTRGEATSYLAAKLCHAGRDGPTFTARSVTVIHGLAEGVPGRLDRLARMALIAAAVGGESIVTPACLAAVEDAAPPRLLLA